MKTKQGTVEWREKFEHLFFKKGNDIRNTGRTRFKKGHKIRVGMKSGELKICKCSKQFYRCPSSKQRFCSFNCGIIYGHINRHMKKGKRKLEIKKICEVCNREFVIKKKTSKFCSHKCQIKSMIGRKQPQDAIEKQRIQISGDKCWFWKGGISKELYGMEFNNQLKEQIRKRDNYRCQECFRLQSELRTKSNRTYKLHIHHIDYDKKNNIDSNLISLCRPCHSQTNYDRNDWTNYYQNKVECKNEI